MLFFFCWQSGYWCNSCLVNLLANWPNANGTWILPRSLFDVCEFIWNMPFLESLLISHTSLNHSLTNVRMSFCRCFCDVYGLDLFIYKYEASSKTQCFPDDAVFDRCLGDIWVLTGKVTPDVKTHTLLSCLLFVLMKRPDRFHQNITKSQIVLNMRVNLRNRCKNLCNLKLSIRLIMHLIVDKLHFAN